MIISKKKDQILKLSGFFLFIMALVIYFLYKLPYNFSVFCGSTNEGFYFVHGAKLLNGYLKAESIPFLIFLYAAIVKLFGFGTISIIVVHFIQTLVVIFITLVLYLLVLKITQSYIYSGFSSLLFVLLLITPVGGWLRQFELESSISLEGEYFCVLTALLAIYYFLSSLGNKKYWLLSTAAGVLSSASIFFKTSGGVVIISFILLIPYLLLCGKAVLLNVRKPLFYFFIGAFVSFIFFTAIVLMFYEGDLLTYWRNSFLIGSYSKDFLYSPASFLLRIYKIMNKSQTFIASNFILFFLAILSFAWGLLRIFILRLSCSGENLAIAILSLWSFGSFFVVLAPGVYASYYYLLLWPSIAIFLVLGISDICKYLNSHLKTLAVFFVTVLILFSFINRLSKVFPTFCSSLAAYNKVSIFSQSESLNDPAIPYGKDVRSSRPYELVLADLINSLLPDKNDKVYLVHFSPYLSIFSPPMYVYIKRQPPTIVLCDYLHYEKYFEDFSKRLIVDLKREMPKVVVVPESWYAPNDRKISLEKIDALAFWINEFVEKNYYQWHSIVDDHQHNYVLYVRR